MVGARQATHTGITQASAIAQHLIENDYTVISGLAAGIDTAAHTAALSRHGRTVGVIGTGGGVWAGAAAAALLGSRNALYGLRLSSVLAVRGWRKFIAPQLVIDETLIAYLATRIERSFAGARAVVERLDREALRLKRPVTRALAAELLSRT